MEVTATELPGVLLVQPRVLGDPRGFFFEMYREGAYEVAGIHGPFVQDNVSRSRRGVLRGLHFQQPKAQGKLVQVLEGEIFDVAVDIRRGSPTFGRWVGRTLSSASMQQLFVPAGFAHGFLVTADSALVMYKCTEYYSATDECAVRWDDPTIGIEWPAVEKTLSSKDAEASLLADLHHSRLPDFASYRT